MRQWIERNIGLMWGTYLWPGAPMVFLAFGWNDRADTLLEIGVAGRIFFVAPLP